MAKNRLKIEYVDINKVLPYAKNAKEHDEKNISEIRASIRAFGFLDPIALDEMDSLIEGHGRIIAAAAEGYKKLPAIRLIGLTEDQKRAYRLVHNRITERAKYNIDILSDEISALSVNGFDLKLTGFTDKEIDMLLENSPDIGDALEPQSVVRTHTRDGSSKNGKGKTTVFEIMVKFKSEKEQDDAYHNLKGLGYKCKMVRG